MIHSWELMHHHFLLLARHGSVHIVRSSTPAQTRVLCAPCLSNNPLLTHGNCALQWLLRVDDSFALPLSLLSLLINECVGVNCCTFYMCIYLDSELRVFPCLNTIMHLDSILLFLLIWEGLHHSTGDDWHCTQAVKDVHVIKW